VKYRLRLIVVACGVSAALGLIRAGNNSPPFDSTLSLLGVTFHVECPNGPEGNAVKITTSGLPGDGAPTSDRIKGTVMGAEVADLNSDGLPEVYVYVRTGEDARGSVIAYGVNRDKSLSRIIVPELSDDPRVAGGYTGRDGYEVVGKAFMRRFPISGGKNRQLQYKLVGGDASWSLQLERVTQY
jgi:hypothetical protein